MRPLPAAALTKTPRQHRSVEMVHTIIDAAIHVLDREGVASFSTNRVAEVAGVSVGSLYQYFGNREMILAAVLERGILESTELMRRLSMAATEASVDDVLREVLYALLAELEPARPLVRNALSIVPLVYDGGVLSVLEARIGDVARDYLFRHRDRYELVGGPAALYAGVNGMTYVFLRWLTDTHRTIDRADLVEALVAMLNAVVRDSRGAAGTRRVPASVGRSAVPPRSRKPGGKASRHTAHPSDPKR